MKHAVEVLTAIGVAAVLAWFGFNWYQQRHPAATDTPLALPGDAEIAPPATTGAPSNQGPLVPPAEPVIENPVEVPPAPLPLPPLADSDDEIRAALAEILAPAALAEYFQEAAMVRKFVLSVDNLTAGTLTPQHRLVKPLAGRFAVIETGDTIMLDPQNYRRYDSLVALLTALDPVQVARLYRQFYPLLQQAYEDLGYPGRYFNDRLIAVIDHLLAAEPPAAPIELVQPKVYYRYADQALEDASVGHRMLFRIGPGHMAAVQRWLQAIRAQLARPPA